MLQRLAFTTAKRSIAIACASAMISGLLPSLPVFAAVATDSLVGYWKFDETSAGSFSDSSGDANTGTGAGAGGGNNTPQPSTDVPTTTFSNTRSLSFDGTDDYVTMGDPASGSFDFGTSQDFTLSAWVKLAASQSDYAGVMVKGTGGAWTGYQLVIVGNKIAAEINDGNATTLGVSDGLQGTTNLNNGAWHHLVMVVRRSSTNARLYVDGSQEASLTNARIGNDLSNSASLYLGSERTLAVFFNGNIDDARLYNRALAPWEISQLYGGNHIQAFWSGTNSNYESRNSWSGTYIPDPYSRLVVRARTNQPTMTGSIQAAGLEIQTGALLNTRGYNVTLNDSGLTTLYGTLAIEGNETLSGVSVTGAKGTVLVFGSGSYTGLPANSVYNLTLNDGLVGYWKLDETSGTRAVDSSGWGNSGSLIGGASISTTVAPTNYLNKRSVSFDGSDDGISIQQSPSLNMAGPFSISVWVNPTTTLQSGGAAGTFADFVSKITQEASGYGYEFIYDKELGKIVLGIHNSGYRDWAVSQTLNANTWYHLVGVWDGSTTTARIYLNGSELSGGSKRGDAGNFSLGSSTASLGIGYWATAASRNFNGFLDDVRVYNRVLAPAEIAALAAGNEPSVGRGSVTLNANLGVRGSLTLNAGTLDVSSSNYQVSLSGSFLNNGGRLAARAGTVLFKGAQAGLELLSGGQRFNSITFQGSAGTWNTRDRLTASGTLTINSGTLDASGSYVIHAGTWTQNGGTFTPRSGTVVLDKQSSVTFTPSSAFNILRIEDPSENGLVGYWKFDEGSNSGSILDSSGFSNNGVRRGGAGLVWTGTVLPTNIAFDNPFAMKFDGTDDYVSADDGGSSSLDISGDLTIALWLNPDTLPAANIAFVAKRGLIVCASNYHFGINDDLGGYNFYNQVTEFQSAQKPSVGVWSHVAMVLRNGSSVTYYTNGVQVDQITAGSPSIGTTNNQPVTIGASCADSKFTGKMDDVRIYNRALSANEIVNLYRGRYANGTSSTATQTLAGSLSAATLNIDSGILSTNASTLTVTNALQILRGNGSLTLGSTTATLNGGLTMSGGLLTGGAGTLNVSGTVRMSTGAIVVPSGTMNVTGNWFQSGGMLRTSAGTLDIDGLLKLTGGIFHAPTSVTLSGSLIKKSATFLGSGSTLTLNGGAQTLSGSFSISNITKTISSATTLSVYPGYPILVSGALVLRGAVSNLLSVRSVITDTAARLRLSTGGSQTIDYLDVKDSDASGGLELVCDESSEGCVNSGNNTNWFFASSAASSSSAAAPDPITGVGGGGGGGRGSPAQMAERIALAQQSILARYEGRSRDTEIVQAASSSSSRGEDLIAKAEAEEKAAKLREQRISERIREHEMALRTLALEKDELQQKFAKRREERLAQELAEKEKQIAKEEADLLAHQEELKEEQEKNRIAREERLALIEAARAAGTLSETGEQAETGHGTVIGEKRGRLTAVLGDQTVLYIDVETDAWYAPFVAYAIEEGIATGYDSPPGEPKEFGVANPITRAEALKMILEAANTDLKAGQALRNTSAKGTWASAYVTKAEEMGFDIVTPDWDVNTPITRGEAIHLLLLGMGIPKGVRPADFPDVPVDHPFSTDIAVAFFYGIIEGYPDGTAKPDAQINRAEFAKIITQMAEVMR